MKTMSPTMMMTIAGALAGILSPLASAQSAARPAMRDIATHDDIVEATRKAKQETPPPVFTPVQGADPSVENGPKDLLTRSEIFCYLGQATLVPKRAVLHVPKDLAGRTGLKEVSKFIPWRDFYLANRGWLRTVAVTRAQAEGREALDEATVLSFAKETRVVVATYQEGPISVIPPQIPPTGTAAVPGTTASNKTIAKP